MMDYENLPTIHTHRGALYIYKIECLANRKKYIGRTASPKYRCQTHRAKLINGKHSNEDMQADFNLYGEKEFTFEILQQCSRKREKNNDCIDGNIEKGYMALFETYDRNHGYNYKDPAYRPRYGT